MRSYISYICIFLLITCDFTNKPIKKYSEFTGLVMILPPIKNNELEHWTIYYSLYTFNSTILPNTIFYCTWFAILTYRNNVIV